MADYCKNELQGAFEEFKHAEEFFILREDIDREQKLYWIMCEAGLIERAE